MRSVIKSAGIFCAVTATVTGSGGYVAQRYASVYGPWAYRPCTQHGVAGHHRHELLSVRPNTVTELGIPHASRPEPSRNVRPSPGKFS